MKKIILAIFTLLLATFSHAKPYKDDCVLEDKHIEKDAIIIDVRTKEEFERGHPKGAVNIPYMFDLPNGNREINKNFINEVNRLTKENYEQPIIVICRIGIRSVQAAEALAEEGYEDLTNIQQGFVKGWKKAGMPVE